MEVDTGNVVAMASMPDYDSNVRVNGGKITQDVVDSSGTGLLRSMDQVARETALNP